MSAFIRSGHKSRWCGGSVPVGRLNKLENRGRYLIVLNGSCFVGLTPGDTDTDCPTSGNVFSSRHRIMRSPNRIARSVLALD
jgi:hypothetical protein